MQKLHFGLHFGGDGAAGLPGGQPQGYAEADGRPSALLRAHGEDPDGEAAECRSAGAHERPSRRLVGSEEALTHPPEARWSSG